MRKSSLCQAIRLKTYDLDNLTQVGFLPKPFDSRRLLDAIERAFGVALALSPV